MRDWTVLVLFALSVARLTGLVTQDEITRPLRDKVIARLDEQRPVHLWLVYLWSCPWCLSFWAGLLLAPLFWWWGDRWFVGVPALALSASQVTGMLSAVGRGE